ncbi:MAG: cell division protein FtsW [Candidatus Stahlbacteria bacterium]|nr:cell division protein FtsW [Candidatus Stahlbacteria bacterium]
MKNVDKTILFITFILVAVGILMVYSSSAFASLRAKDSSTFFLRKQLIPLGIGIILLIVMIKTDYHKLGKWSYFFMAASAVLLIAVLVLGSSIHGVRRWIRFGGISIQPSEFARIAVIIFMADFISREKLQNFKHGLLPVLIPLSVIFFLIGLEPSFGALSVLCLTSFALLFLGGAKVWHLSVLVASVAGAIGFFISQVPYAKMRIAGLGSQEGYQLQQSIYGLGCGGIFGKGLGSGQGKLLFLPEPHTDFIFSVIGEEFGFIGCSVVAFLFLLLLMKGIKVGVRSADQFGFLLACGISIGIFVSACFHIGVVCGVLPTTGLPLPFISFGGSNLLASIIGVGILLNISKMRDVR